MTVKKKNTLAKEKANLQTIFEAVRVGLLLIDSRGRVKKVNNTISRWLGKSPVLCHGVRPGDAVNCIHAFSSRKGCGTTQYCPDCPIRKAIESVATSGEPLHDIETKITVSKDGAAVDLWLEISVDPLELDGENCLLLAMNNISSRKAAEQARAMIVGQMEEERNKHLSDIGTLAATVAHELRNPLAAIRLAAFNIKRKAQDPRLESHLANIETKVMESEQIITNLLYYSRVSEPGFKKINIHNILSSCIQEIRKHRRQEAPKFIARISEIKDLIVEADPLQVKEVFTNILNNAADAVAGASGKVEVSASYSGGSLVIVFQDDGEGIAPEHLGKLFVPFFTTKAKGTGLGLALCRQIVLLHGGSIEISSKKGEGTVVTVILPASRQPRPAA